MRLIARYAGIVLFLATTLSQAAPVDPFPNQPGALSAEEIQAASSAMLAAPGADPALPLVATGKRSPGHSMPMYALFASPLADYSDRVKTRKLIICNFLAQAWRCSTPVEEFRMSANGMQHVFMYQIMQGAGDRQAAVDVAEFMYSPCFGPQYAAIGGTPFTPSPDSDYVNTVVDEGKTLRVITGPLGDGDSYGLERTDKAADNCGFRVTNARIAKSGVMLSESYAQKIAKRIAQAREPLAVERHAAGAPTREPLRETLGPWAIDRDDFAIATMYLAMLCGVLALVAPWFVLARSRHAAARTAGGLAGACTLMAVSSAWYIENYFRIELLVNGALVLLAWLTYAWFAKRAAE